MTLSDTFLITHGGCMDGSTCAALFMAAGGKKQNIIFSAPNHQYVEAHLSELLDTTWEGPIILVDVSVSLNYAETLDVIHRDIYLLDHHDSAIPLSKFDWCKIDKDNLGCGCVMFYNWMLLNGEHHENNRLISYKDLVYTVDDMDRWINENPDSIILSTFHNVLGPELYSERFAKNSEIEFSVQERYLIDFAAEKRKVFIEDRLQNLDIISQEIDGEFYRVAYVEANNYDSLLAKSIYNNLNLDVDIVVVVGQSKVSFRRHPDCSVNLAKVAQLNGGGGHQAASGTSMRQVLGGNIKDLVKSKLIWNQKPLEDDEVPF